MHGSAVTVKLQNQDAWSFREVGVIFEQFCVRQSAHDVTNKDTVFREFIVTVVGYPDLASTCEGHDLLQRTIHAGMLSSGCGLRNDAFIMSR